MKTKYIKLIATVILLAISILSLLSCSIHTSDAEIAIVTQLSEKYGKSFTVYALGNRIGRDTATAYVYADEDPTMLFTALVNDQGELTYEEYAYRTVCRNAENIVTDIFAEYSIEGVCFCRFFPKNHTLAPGIAPEEYVQQANPEDFGITLVVRTSEYVTGENIADAYLRIHERVGAEFTASGLYVLTSADYSKVKDNIILETQTFNEERLYSYGAEEPIIKMTLQIYPSGLSLTAAEIDEMLNQK